MVNSAMANDNDPLVEAAALIFEARLAIEAVSLGLEGLIRRSGASFSAELAALKRMNDQSAEALATLQNTLGFNAPAGQG
jgi:hypothetical protein